MHVLIKSEQRYSNPNILHFVFKTIMKVIEPAANDMYHGVVDGL